MILVFSAIAVDRTVRCFSGFFGRLRITVGGFRFSLKD
jgi:hypothetical protein